MDILKPGLTMLEDLTGKPVLGVIPMEKIDVDDEDSLSDRLNQKTITEELMLPLYVFLIYLTLPISVFLN